MHLSRKDGKYVVVGRGFGVFSVWNVGHLWENSVPDESGSEKLPKKVRERVRQVLQGISYGLLNPDNAGGDDISVEQLWFTGIRRKKLTKKVDHHLHQRIYNRGFLKSVFVRQDEVERWCWRTRRVLPAFWFPDQLNRWVSLTQADVGKENEELPPKS